MNEAAFRAALLDPALPVPDGLTDPQGRPAPRRFAVYRNNVAVSLRDALCDGFPILRRLLGPVFFDAMAGVFLRLHPPQSRLLWQYGEAMPSFLGGFAPVAHLPYLPCVARLELALRESYHAADADPVVPEDLAAIPPERLMRARVRLAPSLRLVASDWPIHGIWQTHAQAAPPPAMAAQAVVVLRPQHDPAPRLLAPGGAAFVAALQAGQRVAQAIEAAGPDHPLSATLTLLLAGGAIVGIEEADV